MIKTIIFDNNGVLTSSDSESIISNVASFLNLKEDIFRPAWEDLAKSLDDGRITTKEFYESVLNHFNITRSLGDFKKVHLGSYSSKVETKKFAKSLKNDYELALLSNFGDSFDECNRKWKLEEIFGDKMFISYKMKMRKPNAGIYQKVLKDLKRKPEETVFIDDNKDNIETARNLGINAILFTDLEKLKKDLGKYIKIDL